jgi:hypothetical protein
MFMSEKNVPQEILDHSIVTVLFPEWMYSYMAGVCQSLATQCCTMYKKNRLHLGYINGTIQRDFLTPVFFSLNGLSWSQ